MSEARREANGKRPKGAAEALLSVGVLSVVLLMIVPLPTWLLDGLIALNLSISVAILLVVLTVPDALAIATFPTLLLLTTLYRLGLNVASSRLILLQADAGEVIRAFGAFVVRGNYVVGGVVFLVLTIIQFVVIARGGERVAEVGARFVLDAMPGKQMAIDAELRAGTIDGAEARRRRRALSRESQFYGSMDGAMKFVKGDVIASLVITVVNVLGGLAVGVLMRGLPASLALKRYALLTIGDGLVSQIPALVLSTAAGILVTRTASEEPDTPLAVELGRQLFGAPRALRAASGFVLALAAVPGLPGAPFAVLAATLFFVARSVDRRNREQERRERAEPMSTLMSSEGKPVFVPMVVPWAVEVSSDLEPLLDEGGPGDAGGLRGAMTAMRERVFAELGVVLPLARVRVAAALPPRTARLSVFEVPAWRVELPEGADAAACLAEVEVGTLARMEARAPDFLGLTEVQRLLDELEPVAPATVRNVVPKPVSLTLLADVLRRLVEERVSVRDLRAILEALSTVASFEKDPLQLAEFVRTQLRRPITFKLTGGAAHLGVHLLDPSLEDAIHRAVTKTPNGSFLTLAPAAARDVIAAVRRVTDGAPAPVLLTRPDIRRFVRKLLESELPEITVVSFAELLPEVTLRPLGKAVLGGA